MEEDDVKGGGEEGFIQNQVASQARGKRRGKSDDNLLHRSRVLSLFTVGGGRSKLSERVK